MSRTVEFTTGARKELASLDRAVQLRISKKIDALASNPFPKQVTRLVESDNLMRVRVGDYRIVYQVTATRLTITQVGHRSKVYKK